MNIIHKHNYSPPTGQVFTQPSKTIPDHTMTIRELADRFARGLPLNGTASTPVYLGDTDVPNTAHMDLADKEDYLNEIRDKYNDLVKKEQAKEAQKQSDREAQLITKYEEAKKQLEALQGLKTGAVHGTNIT